MGPSATVDALNISYPCRESNHDFLVFRFVILVLCPRNLPGLFRLQLRNNPVTVRRFKEVTVAFRHLPRDVSVTVTGLKEVTVACRDLYPEMFL